jgi:Zn-dependent protease
LLQVKPQDGGLEFRISRLPPIRLYIGMPLVALLLTVPLWRGFHLQGLATAALVALGIISSVLAHELGHAIVAKRVGMKPVLIRLHAAGGDMEWAARNWIRSDEQKVLLAGPLVNLLIGLACLAAYELLLPPPIEILDPTTGRPLFSSPPPRPDPILFRALHWLGWINLALGAVNLLPAYPLDGGRMLHNWIERRTDPRRAKFWVGLSGTVLGVVTKIVFVVGFLAGFLIWSPPYIAPNWAALKASRRARPSGKEKSA